MLTNTATARQLRQRKFEQQQQARDDDLIDEDDEDLSSNNRQVPSYAMAVRGYPTSVLHSPGRNR